MAEAGYGPDKPLKVKALMSVGHPGESRDMLFVAYNPSDQPMSAQAIPSVSPSKAAAFFHKTECFCFTEQTLKPGESVLMPVVFFVDPRIREDEATDHIDEITLSYTFHRTS